MPDDSSVEFTLASPLPMIAFTIAQPVLVSTHALDFARTMWVHTAPWIKCERRERP
jgi:hypothetical protein